MYRLNVEPALAIAEPASLKQGRYSKRYGRNSQRQEASVQTQLSRRASNISYDRSGPKTPTNVGK
ncbi:MAG: hypothetical protein HC849_29565 [Oscillatoriales cyanobacterium RU_3_3]|nr:hypothetical protein [Oscillatoriales cyanobacterium RU_3_3]